MIHTLTPCAHCHARRNDVRLRRIPFVGLRPLCDPCTEAMNRMGYGVKAA